MIVSSKLPGVGTTIFTVMSALAQEHGAINLAQGFPDFASSQRLSELVAHYMRQGYNQYAPMAGLPLLRQRIAEKIDGLYGVKIDPDQEITITAGATQGIFTAIGALVNPGDEVIIFEPAYDSYRPSIELFGGITKSFELNAPDYSIDWNQLRRLISMKTRMIIINTPQNPTGKIFKPADMQALEKLVGGTDIILLSDEVYEHLVYDGHEHESILRYPGLRNQAVAVYSFGKTFHTTGWKVGYCIAPPNLTAEFRKVHQFNVFSVNTPVQYGLADFLEDPHEYLGLGTFFTHKRDIFLDAIEGSRFRPLLSEGSYFQLCDYSEISTEPDVDFCRRLTQDYGVAAIPLSVFYHSKRDDKIIRFCFAKKEETLELAGKRLREI
ncbi:methionine aminotransferase [Haliscomenobacter hydrossis]|uniref:Kynurenine--oxoglutarate transaminase n=1 Tax=Haliscomenobacter hydrossis (strain ATCC 27775 / DSM 1100 / LMG 10767 / O) TaxID=760192 RepID=F4KPP4_HALH1|nr:methionine aminotransferase [Haliscomenobacter hydrossis]AEE50982.1 Kynurenine--oxoglutarate transaminase [Haliscomenobacter hydrossis DSM 1100]